MMLLFRRPALGRSAWRPPFGAAEVDYERMVSLIAALTLRYCTFGLNKRSLRVPTEQTFSPRWYENLSFNGPKTKALVVFVAIELGVALRAPHRSTRIRVCFFQRQREFI